MKIITINMPEQYFEGFQVLVDLEMYPSRSQALRIALEEFLPKELKILENLKQKNFDALMRGNGGVKH